jgi:hypothetical protein
MKALISRHWSDISDSIGVLCGFILFFAFWKLGLSSEVSFGMSFVSGYALTYFLNHTFDDTVEQYSAKNISHMVQTFEGK